MALIMTNPLNTCASEQNNQQAQQESPTSTAETNVPVKKKFRLLIAIAKLLVLILVIVWITLQLQKSWTEILAYAWTPRWSWLIASGLFYLCGYFPASLFWYLSLCWLGQKPNFFKSILAYYSSQLGKYVPGKAMVVVIRTGMIVSERVRVSVAAVSVFYETLTMMGSGAFIGALIVFFFFRENAVFSLIALGVAVCSVTPLLPPLFVRVLKVLKVGKNDPNVQEALKNLKYRHLIIGFALMTVLWVFFGLSLWAVIRGIGVEPGPLLDSLPRYIASVSLATSLGFVVVISPGGLGVREMLLSKLLIPFFSLILGNPVNSAFNIAPEALATIISILQRIISIIAEVLTFLIMAICYVCLKKRRPNQNQ